MARDDKIELAKKVIGIKKEIDEVKREGHEERRKLANKIHRLFKEIRYVYSKNQKDILLLQRRQTDTEKYLKKIKKYADWAIRLIIGILLTTIIGVFLNIIIKAF